MDQPSGNDPPDPAAIDYAESELRYNRFMTPAYRTALATLGLPADRPSRGLDIGCGPGGLFPLLDEATGGRASILGLDLSAPHLAAAHTLIDDSGLATRVRLERADLRQPLPLADAALDWAVAFDVLWPALFERPDAVVAEMARVVRPGGRVAVWFLAMARGVTLLGYPEIDAYVEMAARRSWLGGAAPEHHPERAIDWLLAAGLANASLTWHSVAGGAPLDSAARDFLGGYLLPERRTLGRDELAAVGMDDPTWHRWRTLSDPDSEDFVLARDDYHYRHVALLAAGTVPTTSPPERPTRRSSQP